jgi:predicted nucleic acid-binding protein
MKITIDTSNIMAVVTNEKHKGEIIKHTKNAELIAPASLHWEVGNAFSAMFKRGRITLALAIKAIQEYYKIPIQFYDTTLEQALDYAQQYELYVYDAFFLVCAKNLRVPFYSLDKALLKVAKEIGITIIEAN